MAVPFSSSSACHSASISRFRSISAAHMAEAILDLAQEKAGGRFVHEYDALMRAARRLERSRAERAAIEQGEVGKGGNRKLA